MLYTSLPMSTLRNSCHVTAMELWHKVGDLNKFATLVYCLVYSLGAAGAIASLITRWFHEPS